MNPNLGRGRSVGIRRDPAEKCERLSYSPRNVTIVSLVAALIGLFGCSRSPVVEYYTLLPEVAVADALSDSSGLPTIQVVLPTLPALVDRAEFTEIAAGNRVIVHENVRWAVGLRKTLRDYFVAHLRQEIPTLDVLSSANQVAVPGGQKLLLVFDRFDIHAGNHLDISMSWRLLSGQVKLFDKRSDLNQRNKIRVKLDLPSDQPSDAIEAIKSALGAIGDEISQALLTQQ